MSPHLHLALALVTSLGSGPLNAAAPEGSPAGEVGHRVAVGAGGTSRGPEAPPADGRADAKMPSSGAEATSSEAPAKAGTAAPSNPAEPTKTAPPAAPAGAGATATKGSSSLTPLPAPLGRIGDVLLSPSEAAQSTDWVRSYRFEGCEQDIRVSLARLLSGVSAAGAEVQRWVDQQPGGSKRFFAGSVSPLVEAFSRARLSVPSPDKKGKPTCAAMEEKWKLTGLRAHSQRCPKTWEPARDGLLERFETSASTASSAPPATTAWAFIAPGAPEAKDRCLPRISVTLFDAKRRARLRYHADYSGALEAELLADRCQSILFTFDRSTQRFLPTIRAGGQGCAQKSSLHRP